MELKTKYQYSYFIQPYIIEERNYEKHLLRLLKNKNCKQKIFEKQRDLDIYSYFLPKIRNYMFWSFDHLSEELQNLKIEEKAKKISKYSCNIFEYTLEKNMQAKIGQKDGIFFAIDKIEIICFQTGVCFLLLKTTLEENKMSDILNFNYKFREIHSDMVTLKEYENIRLQTSNFKDTKELAELITEIIGPNESAKALNLNEEKFLVYSYLCVDPENWNESNHFEKIKGEFIKYSKFLPNNYQINFESEEDVELFQNWKYVKIGFSSQGTALLTSGINTNNYTKLPFIYENEYLYTYILALYQKIYLKKIENEIQQEKDIRKVRRRFASFVKDVWAQEITEDIDGIRLYNNWKEALNVTQLFKEIKEKYEVTYEELNVEKIRKYNRTILFILALILGVNIVALYFLFF